MSDQQTPTGVSSGITRRNILDALTGSKGSVVKTVAQQKVEQEAQQKKRRMEKNLEALEDRRDMLVEKLERMKGSLEDVTVSVHLLKLYEETLRRSADDYDKNYSDIIVLLPKERRAEQRGKYAAFEKLHSTVYEKLQARIAESELTTKLLELPKAPAAAVAPPQPVYIQAPAPVPHLQAPFPTFNGKPEGWYSFKNLFQSIMSRYTNDPPAMKILYLRNALVDDAKDKIDQDVVNNNDYDAAWRILEDEYEDKRLILDTHIDAILDCPKVAKESRGKSISKLVEVCAKHSEALAGHGYPVEGLAELVMVNVIYKKLDKETQEQWELKIGSGALPEFEEFMEFLRERGRVLQRTNRSQQQPAQQSTVAPSKQRQAFGQKAQPLLKSFVQATTEVCGHCKEDHPIYRCSTFRDLSVPERKSVATKANLCYNCLKARHRVSDCESKTLCKVQGCGRKHHSLLHDSGTRSNQGQVKKEESSQCLPVAPSVPAGGPATAPAQQSSAVSLCANVGGAKHQVLLSTAEVMVIGQADSTVKCRALLDSGSDSNIITEKLANKLKLKMDRVDLPVSGLNDIQTRVKYLLSTKIESCVNAFASPVLDFLVVPRITSNLPVVEIDVAAWPLPPGLQLADPKFHTPGEIDLIIGNEIFFDLVKSGRVKIGRNAPTLAETELGWVLGGAVPTRKAKPCPRVCQLNHFEEELNKTMVKFWEIECVHPETDLTVAEAAVEEHFQRTHSRDAEGRFVVRLPFNNQKSQLGDSYNNARKRLDKLMISLARNPAKRVEYSAFLTEYLTLGHMKEVQHVNDGGYYIPHHAVYKASSSTTKTRVVFDASAKTTSGLSLNDTLDVGPTVQNDLLSIILKFCTHPVVLTADIPKMYRQVKLHQDDCKYQRILWLDDDRQLKVYELQTVTYGLASSPHHATRALVQLATDEGKDLPLAARVVKRDSYVDDFLTGGSSVAEVVQIYKELTELLRRGGFGVHKFCSNSTEVLRAIPAELHEKQVDFGESDVNNTIKTLGLIWNPLEDYFVFRVPRPINEEWTKRIVLSEISSLFDPCGFLGPIITLCKLVMQDVWVRALTWDQPLPVELSLRWRLIRVQLPAISKMRKKRCLIAPDAVNVQLHGFSDASKRAYGGVLYIRSVNKCGEISVCRAASKSRVAPLKEQTIPRLEACGAKLLAELTQKVMAALEVPFDDVVLHCDSKIVLCWLKKPPSALKQFVSNRVAAIQKLTREFTWRFIRSEHNPADVLSRGALPEDLLEHELWEDGAPELWEHQLPEDLSEPFDESQLPELKPAIVLTVVNPKPAIDFTRCSNYRRLQRSWVYVERYINLAVHKRRETSGISADEVARAEKTILAVVQKQAFGDLLKLLRSNSNKQHSWSNLAPFLGEDGLIRVGGRLKYSAIPYDGKHQVLLPDGHHVTKILVRKLHEENFHVGQNGLLAIVRERYWPLRAGLLIKQVVTKCQICRRQNPKPGSQFMGNLPGYRINPAPPFSKVGIDYAGPFMLKTGGRGSRLQKAYVVVFVCMVVKAIHFELVTNLSTDNFIAALQRFASRRGLPSDIHSDNATCFAGGNNELAALRELFNSQLHKNKLEEFCSLKGIRWHFIPPRSPHFGGIWEAGVKSMKHHMKRVVGETKLTYEEMTTFLAQTEAILNSRPLCPMSEDPNDLTVLTPSHFLISRSGVALPEPSYADEKVGRLSRWQHIQYMQQHFWKRWSGEYLHQLQGRPKWNAGVKEFKVGELVLLIDENLPPQQWRRGRIVATHPGEDGAVRVVTVKTATSEFKRAITKVALMPSVEPDASTGGECLGTLPKEK